jgi:DNA-binding PucR family transcriptional regulator
MSGEVVWGWLGSGKAPDDAEWRALVRTDPPAGTCIAIGVAEHGSRGFVRSHQQASAARRVALATGQSLTTYHEVALEALASRDADAARAFLECELRPLAGDDKADRLRETLRAYFAAGQNAAAAAAMLDVHEQTIAYRLRAIEKRLGYPAAMRRAELETALRLERLLAGPG